ncbi:hypothetical protein SVIOM74S_04132 [Streptomyces violarus]
MLGLELVVLLGVAVLAGNVLAQRLGVAPPVVLLALGALLGLVPAVRQTQLPPEVVLLLFLPVLLYWESLTTSSREIRSNLRGIVLMSTLLVILTAWAVAAAGHALGLPWGPAWVLGAAVAPTDATAVGALARALPRRQVTVLRAESLVNDGTALVIFGLAVGLTVGEEHLTVPHVGALFLLAYGGGAAVGVAVAWVNMNLRRRLQDPLLGNLVMILAPFTAYLLAELIHASGVLAVVVCGLIMAQVAPRIIRAEHRRQALAFWPLATFIINATLFVLVGVELQYALRHMSRPDLTDALIAIGVVSVVLVVVRFAFLFGSAYLIRALDRRPEQRLRRMSDRARTVSGFAGFRGAVSLAVALSVPEILDSGAPFPNRDFIVFVTSGVESLTEGYGLSEEIIGRWLAQGGGWRDRIVCARSTSPWAPARTTSISRPTRSAGQPRPASDGCRPITSTCTRCTTSTARHRGTRSGRPWSNSSARARSPTSAAATSPAGTSPPHSRKRTSGISWASCPSRACTTSTPAPSNSN